MKLHDAPTTVAEPRQAPRRVRSPNLSPPLPVSYATRCVVLLIASAIALRIAFAIASNKALAHPDEHQQYLEQAIVHAHGYGVTFWEQDRHMRHPLLPAVLGGMVRGLDAIGLHEPATQAIVLRMTLSLTSLAAMLAWAWRWRRDGESPAAVFVLVLAASCFDVLWIQSRVLSDNAVAAPLLFALICERRRPLACGLLLALAFAVRFQVGFFVAPLLAWSCFDNRRDLTPTLRTAAGLGLGLSILFGGEWLLCGVCSPMEYWRACIAEGGAAQFKVQPWWYYLVHGVRDLLRASLLLPLALWIGGRRERRWAACAVVFLIAHSFVGHKEVRFTWTLMPLAVLLAARGFGEIWKRSPRRGTWAVVIVLSFLIPSLVRIPLFSWKTDDYAASCDALAFVARQHDVNGVVVLGVPDYRCGNHFYFRRDLPLVLGPRRIPEGVDRTTYCRGPLPLDDDPRDVVADALRRSPTPNYWIVTDPQSSLLPEGRFDRLGRFGELNVLRRRS